MAINNAILEKFDKLSEDFERVKNAGHGQAQEIHFSNERIDKLNMVIKSNEAYIAQLQARTDATEQRLENLECAGGLRNGAALEVEQMKGRLEDLKAGTIDDHIIAGLIDKHEKLSERIENLENPGAVLTELELVKKIQTESEISKSDSYFNERIEELQESINALEFRNGLTDVNDKKTSERFAQLGHLIEAIKKQVDARLNKLEKTSITLDEHAPGMINSAIIDRLTMVEEKLEKPALSSELHLGEEVVFPSTLTDLAEMCLKLGRKLQEERNRIDDLEVFKALQKGHKHAGEDLPAGCLIMNASSFDGLSTKLNELEKRFNQHMEFVG